MNEKVFNRKVYKDIKKFDRQQMEDFVKNVYTSGFNDGAEAGAKADFKIILLHVLEHTKGVGSKTRDKILATYRTMEGVVLDENNK